MEFKSTWTRFDTVLHTVVLLCTFIFILYMFVNATYDSAVFFLLVFGMVLCLVGVYYLIKFRRIYHKSLFVDSKSIRGDQLFYCFGVNEIPYSEIEGVSRFSIIASRHKTEYVRLKVKDGVLKSEMENRRARLWSVKNGILIEVTYCKESPDEIASTIEKFLYKYNNEIQPAKKRAANLGVIPKRI